MNKQDIKVVQLTSYQDHRAVDLYEVCGVISGTMYQDNEWYWHGQDDIEYLREEEAKQDNL